MGRFGLLIMASAAILFSGNAEAASPSPQKSPQILVQTLMQAPAPGSFTRSYSLAEILSSADIRTKLTEVSIKQIAFRTNSGSLKQKDYPKLQGIAQALTIILSYNPREYFLIEGHTDAPGNKNYNAKLSHLRALNIKQILVGVFGIPAGNIAVAGYGEEFLKIKVRRSEPRNRRVIFRRITAALMAQAAAPAPMPGSFRPSLQPRGSLPFTPPNVTSPFAAPQLKPAIRQKPKVVPFVPQLLMRRSLPFTPPNVMAPF